MTERLPPSRRDKPAIGTPSQGWSTEKQLRQRDEEIIARNNHEPTSEEKKAIEYAKKLIRQGFWD